MDDLGQSEDWRRMGIYLNYRLRSHAGIVTVRRAPGGLVFSQQSADGREETIAYCRDDLMPWAGSP